MPEFPYGVDQGHPVLWFGLVWTCWLCNINRVGLMRGVVLLYIGGWWSIAGLIGWRVGIDLSLDENFKIKKTFRNL